MDKIACAYIRVSTDTQDEYSPDAQIRLLKEYAASNDIILSEVYQDIGISGRKAEKRPQFQEMIAAAKSKEHPYDVILVWKFSRFARNQEESIVYKSLLKKNNVEVVSVSEPLPEGFIGELVERIFEWMDEYYSIRLSGEVKRGMAQKALSGGYNNRPPIGYIKDRGSDTVPYPDEYYADMVRKCFHMFAIEQRPISPIAAHINALGYRTRNGNLWESRNIVDMIQNPFYIGKIRWNYTENRARKLDGETIIVDGSHEPIISEELFEAANKRYNLITATQNHNKRSSVQKHWLSGVMKCPSCGGSLAYQRGYDKRKDKESPHFLCWKSVKGLCTTRNSISQAKAEKDVMDGLQRMIDNFDIVKIAPIQKYDVDSDEISKQIKSLNTKLSRVKDAYINGVDTLEEYRFNRTRLDKEIDKLESMRSNPPAIEPLTKEKIESVYQFIEASDVVSDKAAALRTIVDYVIYDKTTDTMEFFMKS